MRFKGLYPLIGEKELGQGGGFREEQMSFRGDQWTQKDNRLRQSLFMV